MATPTNLMPTMTQANEMLSQAAVPVPTVPHVAGRYRSLKLAQPDEFVVPSKRIANDAALSFWTRSEAFLRILDFIESVNVAVCNKRISDPCQVSDVVARIISVLDEMDAWINDIPPESIPQRFGNISFRKWMDRLSDESVRLTSSILPAHRTDAVHELSAYLAGGFGDKMRIDYGSGHELSFVCFLCCLDLLQVVSVDDHAAVCLRAFVRYLALVRRLQTVYNLEPAGSHGVWGLDDHQFLPYVWGSSQLLDHQRIKPKSIMQKDIVEHFAKEYLYLGCIDYINKVKRGPFFEHSPLLYDISGVLSWQKVNSGLLKMYLAEVLNKFPVIQHLLFGNLLPFAPAIEPGNEI